MAGADRLRSAGSEIARAGGGAKTQRGRRSVASTPVSSSRTLCYPCRTPDDDVTAELERLRAENAQLKRTASRDRTLKVSEKGGVSVYGLGRFPVTLYKEQWTKLLDMADNIRAFIWANEASLKTKT